VLLAVAGNETTASMIGNPAAALLDHPAEIERMAREPGLVPARVEETPRSDAPAQLLPRNAHADTEIAGVPVPKASIVARWVGSANRDERREPEPGAFRVGRSTRGHPGFGFGVHFCLGAAPARLEAAVALEAPELERARHARGPARGVRGLLPRARPSQPLARGRLSRPRTAGPVATRPWLRRVGR